MTWDEAFQNAGKIAAILGVMATIWFAWGTDFGFMALTAVMATAALASFIAFIAIILKVIVWLINRNNNK